MQLPTNPLQVLLSCSVAIGLRGSLSSLLRSKLLVLLLHHDFDSAFQLRPISKEEQQLDDFEEWRGHQAHVQVCEKCWSSALKHAVADKLRNPAYTPDSESDPVGRVWRNGGEMLEVSRGSNEYWCEEGAGDRLKEDIEDRVVGRSKRAEVEV